MYGIKKGGVQTTYNSNLVEGAREPPRKENKNKHKVTKKTKDAKFSSCASVQASLCKYPMYTIELTLGFPNFLLIPRLFLFLHCVYETTPHYSLTMSFSCDFLHFRTFSSWR